MFPVQLGCGRALALEAYLIGDSQCTEALWVEDGWRAMGAGSGGTRRRRSETEGGWTGGVNFENAKIATRRGGLLPSSMGL
jgi:hypothetical protein